MKKLKTTLAALITSATFASGAMADEKKEAAAPHTDYFSIGATGSLVTDTGSNEGKPVGIRLTRRAPFKENLGFQLTWAAAPRFASAAFDFSFDNVVKNLEFYLGGGAAIYNKPELCFSPHMGLKYHIGESHGVYLGGEMGVLLGLNRAGAYGTLEMGVRFDLSPTSKKK